ncbi:ATPase, T2SS/T4P/T4SS family [Saxibacter everestensis]|uniref:ATPase, T2SS/T4P/T4SS family n=1 Tax=Saxibacter everestensis TaxID=2909229 RepID=A0ABY8QR31_9MICO|nr:ATPase, T2SS/T4P/T4SS family [Brevibacteriaceae bacterium ZFBP1038]
MDAIAIVEDEVRELVRRRGLDPRTDTSEMKSLVAAVVADYDDRYLAGGLPQLHDQQQAIRHVVDAIAGLGPLQQYLDDDDIEEIWLNDPRRIFVSRNGISELTPTLLSEDQVRDLVERMLKTTGRRVDLSSPFVDATLPNGARLHVVLPDITRKHIAINIRKFVARTRTLGDLVAARGLTTSAARFLHASVIAGLNIVISGATQAGKTTLLNTLAASIPARERVISCEEVFEIDLPNRDWVAMQCRQPSLEGTGEIALRKLVKEALRMRPNRIIVGEVREAESLDLLIALNSGLSGMSTLHANSARNAINKLCTLPLLAGENISSRFVVPAVASCLDLVVHCRLEADGQRRVSEVLSVPGGVENDTVEAETIFTSVDGRLIRADGFPTHAGRFSDAGFNLSELLATP